MEKSDNLNTHSTSSSPRNSNSPSSSSSFSNGYIQSQPPTPPTYALQSVLHKLRLVLEDISNIRQETGLLKLDLVLTDVDEIEKDLQRILDELRLVTCCTSDGRSDWKSTLSEDVIAPGDIEKQFQLASLLWSEAQDRDERDLAFQQRQETLEPGNQSSPRNSNSPSSSSFSNGYFQSQPPTPPTYALQSVLHELNQVFADISKIGQETRLLSLDLVLIDVNDIEEDLQRILDALRSNCTSDGRSEWKSTFDEDIEQQFQLDSLLWSKAQDRDERDLAFQERQETLELGNQSIQKESRFCSSCITDCWKSLKPNEREALLNVSFCDLMHHSPPQFIEDIKEALKFAVANDTWICRRCWCCNAKYANSEKFYQHFAKVHLSVLSRRVKHLICNGFWTPVNVRTSASSGPLLESNARFQMDLKQREKIALLDKSVQMFFGSKSRPMVPSDASLTSFPTADDTKFFWGRLSPEEFTEKILTPPSTKWKSMCKDRKYAGSLLYSILQNMSADDNEEGAQPMHISDELALEEAVRKLSEGMHTVLQLAPQEVCKMRKNASGTETIDIKFNPFGLYDYRLVISPLVRSIIKARLEDLADEKRVNAEHPCASCSESDVRQVGSDPAAICTSGVGQSTQYVTEVSVGRIILRIPT